MNRFLWVGVVCIFAFSVTAGAAEVNNFVSVKKGNVKSNGGLSSLAQFAKDDGSIKEVEFLWGSKDYAKVLGGVKLDSNNKINGYMFGFMLNDTDMVSIRNASTNDELYKWDLIQGNVGTFGHINAKSTEYTYEWKSSSRSDAYYQITYGTSNFPAIVDVSNVVQNGFSGTATFVDPRPKFEYLYWGLDADPIRDSLMGNQDVKDQPLGGNLFYGAMKMGFGLLKTKLSDVQFNNNYSAATVNTLGLANQKGNDFYMPFHVEVGMYFQVKSSSVSGIGTLGAYWCVFHGHLATDPTHIRPPSPRQSGH